MRETAVRNPESDWTAGVHPPPAQVLLHLNAVILGVPYNMSSGFYGISFFTILVTLYLLFSERSANTYGLHGRTAPENPKA